MAKSPKKQTTKKVEKGIDKHSSSKVKTTKDIVREHLADEDHMISEEDMKVKIDLDLPKDKAHAPLPIKKDKGRPKDMDKDPEIITSWDVLKE